MALDNLRRLAKKVQRFWENLPRFWENLPCFSENLLRFWEFLGAFTAQAAPLRAAWIKSMKCHRGAKRGGLLFLRRLFFLFTDGELLQVVGGAVVDVQIHIARDAINLATVGELPKFPFTLVG